MCTSLEAELTPTITLRPQRLPAALTVSLCLSLVLGGGVGQGGGKGTGAHAIASFSLGFPVTLLLSLP